MVSVQSQVPGLMFNVEGSENYSAGRGKWGVFEPNVTFLRNIDNYKQNRYLNVGKHRVKLSF